MSENVGIAGFSIKLNEEDQTENRLKEISKLFGYDWEDNFGWEDILWDTCDYYLNRWKPHMDVNNKYGFTYLTFYEYQCYYIENYAKITDMGKALKNYIDKTKIIPKEEIQTFTVIYYNGSESPFKF